nr:EcsC family protein [Neosynechococcus sphagnicola]
MEDILEGAVEDNLVEGSIEAIFKRAVENLIEKFSGSSVPILGIPLGVMANHSFMTAVTVAAQRVFQFRWLRDHQQLQLIRQPLPGAELVS